MYYDGAYAPFGEPYAQSGTADPAFTGQRQDTVAGLYDFPARQYSYQGRWSSPDPAGLAAVDPFNPQSWNRYAYVLNNPLAMIDPLGLCGGGPGDSGDPCVPFSYIDGSGCLNSVTYFPGQGSDGNTYDIPFVTTTCMMLQGGWNSILYSSGGSSGGGAAGAGNSTSTNTASPLTNLTSNLLNLDVCIENNAKNYSISGVANLTTGHELPFLDNQVTSTALLFTGQLGLSESATGTLGVGKDAYKAFKNNGVMTNGPNSLTTLNPARGSPQPVLGNGTNHSTSFLGKAAKVGATAKGIVDVALSGALVLDCAVGQIQ
jgi:RHS repeat-associated protein